jgi:hypothetical protein
LHAIKCTLMDWGTLKEFNWKKEPNIDLPHVCLRSKYRDFYFDYFTK